MADEILDKDNQIEPPTLPKLPTSRKIRHQVKRALQFHRNILTSIYAMSESPPFDTFIRKFCIVPLFIYFWTNEQSRFYDEILKNTYIILTIDATGSIFQKIEPPKINHILENKILNICSFTPSWRTLLALVCHYAIWHHNHTLLKL